jgi:hypothetical protein
MAVRPELPAVAALLVAGPAAAITGGSEDSLQLVGSLRTVVAVTANHGSPLVATSGGAVNASDGIGQALLRIEGVARPAPGLVAELHLLQAVSFASAGEGLWIIPALGTERYRLLASGWAEARPPGAAAQLGVDRASVTWRGPRASVSLGRQPVTFGKAHFWNPLDVFQPFDARAFDRDYKPGVDAARLDVELGETSGVTAVCAWGRRDGSAPPGADRTGSAALLHAYASLAGWDVAAQGGKVYGGWQLGGGLAGSAGPVDLRAEAAAFLPERGDPLPRGLAATAAAGHRFQDGTTVEAQLLYQGAARAGTLADRVALLAAGRLLQASPLVAGGLAERDLGALVRGSVGLLASLWDGSLALMPGITASLSNEAELVAGATVGAGRRAANGMPRSEFGSAPDVFYVEFKAYF